MSGSQRTVHFARQAAAMDQNRQAAADPPTVVAALPVVAPAVPADRPEIVTWGRMSIAARHINKQVSHLPVAESDYHGTLQMIVTAAKDVQAAAEELLRSHGAPAGEHATRG